VTFRAGRIVFIPFHAQFMKKTSAMQQMINVEAGRTGNYFEKNGMPRLPF
jgi:hypothetical protein